MFSGLANHISNSQLVPFIGNMHTALWTLAAVSLVGAAVAAARPKHQPERVHQQHESRSPSRENVEAAA